MSKPDVEPKFRTADELLASCLPMRQALEAAFDRVWDTDDEMTHAECCGSEVAYTSGIFGGDAAQCRTCGSRVANVLSPHVSPILMSPEGNYTHIPSEKFIAEVGNRNWCWHRASSERSTSGDQP